MALKTISPDNYFKQIWDIFILIIIIYIAIDLPLRLAYNQTITNLFFELMVTLALAIDILIKFNSQTYAKGILLKDRKQIAGHYLHSLFLFDFLATIPFLYISSMFPAILLIRWLSLTRLLKLFDLRMLISRLRHQQIINPGIIRLSVFFFWIFLIAHWIASLWIYVARIELLDTIPRYLDAIYWCITTITTVGYGDISPVTDLQKILTMAAMIVGVGVYGYVIGNVASLISNIDITRARYLKQLEDINSFLTYKSVSKRVRQKVNDYYHYIWDNRIAQEGYEILRNLPPSIRTELSLEINKKLIQKVPFFKNTDKAFISDVISQLEQQIFLPGDIIFKQGDIGNCIYFISSGTVNVLADDNTTVLATLKEGDYFGEIALIKKVTRTRTVVADYYCNLYALDKTNFDLLLAKYPKFKDHIYETIKRRQKEPLKTKTDS